MRHFIALSVLLAVPVLAQSSDLLLYAPLDGSGDAALARGDGHQQGGLLTFVPGLRGQAVSVISDLAYPTAGNFRAEAGTVGLWLRPHWDGTDLVAHHLFCLYGQRDLPNSWAINRYNAVCSRGQCGFQVFSSQEGKTFSIAAPVRSWKKGEWHHVALAWSGVNSGKPDAELRLYLDGVLAASLTGKQIDVGPTNDTMSFGRDQDASPDYADADYDDLFVYGRALTDAEIAEGVKAARDLPYEATVTAAAGRAVKGWWDTGWPYRVRVELPPAGVDRKDLFVQCPLHAGGDLSALGLPGTVDLTSVRVVERAGSQWTPLACRVEDAVVEWQCPGVTKAGAARAFDLYFRTDSYQYPRPLVAQKTRVPVEATLAPPVIPDYATTVLGKPWDFNDGTFSGIDQWGNKPEYLRNRKVANGILSFDVTQDPWFIWGDMWGQVDTTHQKIAIDLSQFPVLEMKVRQSVPSAKWELYGRVGNSSNLMRYDFPVNGSGWQRLRIDLQKDARWSGVLSALRIDPTQDVADAHIEIDWVRLLAVTPVSHEAVATIGNPSGVPTRLTLTVANTTPVAGSTQVARIQVTDAAGKPVSGQPVRMELTSDSGGSLAQAPSQRSLAVALNARTRGGLADATLTRRGLTDDKGELLIAYTASHRAVEKADTLTAEVEFADVMAQGLFVSTLPGPPHHYRVEPAKVVALKPDALPLKVSAQLVDEFDNPVTAPRSLTWSIDAEGALHNAASKLDATGQAAATWTGEESKRWVYHVRVKDDQGLTGDSAAICLLPSQPRTDPIVLGPNGNFRKGKEGPAWTPLGGFYANWVGLPRGGEEGRQLISFVDADEAQMNHWLDFLASQGVTAMRFMLRAHTPRGMEPMDIIGRVNMPLFAKALRYMDLARKHDIRFLLTIHEDYTKPAYYDQHALETFCLPQYVGENLDSLPPFQRRFVRDHKLIDQIGLKYTDPDVMACQDQYTRQLVGLLKDNPQLFGWEFENEMVDCPQSWAQHMAGVIRSVDPVTPICASHGGGGINTADPLWWTKKSGIDFYTYHQYPHLTSTSPEIDYGSAIDILTTYGRMAGVCMLGESAGDEFEVYPKDRDADRRYIMRDIIWFSLVNGNPGCFFWNSRGYEVEQFKLANKIVSGLDLHTWRRVPAPVAISVEHPWEDDKYYRSPAGLADYAMMGKYAQHYRTAAQSFDFTMGPGAASLRSLNPPASSGPLTVPAGWQAAAAQSEAGEGLAYIRNFSGLRHWEVPGKANFYIRNRQAAPLVVQVKVAGKVSGTATDLDTGAEKAFTLDGAGQVDLGTSDHDWAMAWKSVK